MTPKQVAIAMAKINRRNESEIRLSGRARSQPAEPIKSEKKKPKHRHRTQRAKRYSDFKQPRTEREKEYQNYLKSGWWKRRRKEYLAKFPNCQKCGSIACIEVHHIRYYFDKKSILYAERDEDLQGLCNVCHGRHHGRNPRVFTAKDYANNKSLTTKM